MSECGSDNLEKLLGCRITLDDVGYPALEKATLGVRAILRAEHTDDLAPLISQATNQPWREKRADVVDEENLEFRREGLFCPHHARPDPTTAVIEKEPVNSVWPFPRRSGEGQFGTQQSTLLPQRLRAS